MARLQQKTQAAVTTGSAGSTGIPRATVLRLIRDLPGVPGLLASVAREIVHELDPSVGGSGPRDFAVRDRHHASVDAVASIASRATFRDDREAPLLVGTGQVKHYTGFDFRKSEIFLPTGLDAVSENQPVGQIIRRNRLFHLA